MKQWWDHSWKWPECSLGILLILLGLIALFLPGMILGVLSLALGIPILVFGAVQIVRSVRLYKMKMCIRDRRKGQPEKGAAQQIKGIGTDGIGA